jgi:hypothetical protein
MLKRLLRQDWEAVAGVLAAITALILHFLHITEADIILAIALVLLAILLFRDIRHENQAERLALAQNDIIASLGDIQSALHPPEVVLIGPKDLRSQSGQFAHKGKGEVVWFNICLRMYRPQQPFDLMLRPFIENPDITSIRFVLDTDEKDRWQTNVLPKVAACSGSKKVQEPFWCQLKENVSFVIVETGPEGEAEALVSFWGEPFMAMSTEKNVPRYVLYVKKSSEMIARLKEHERICRFQQ